MKSAPVAGPRSPLPKKSTLRLRDDSSIFDKDLSHPLPQPSLPQISPPMRLSPVLSMARFLDLTPSFSPFPKELPFATTGFII